MYKLILFFLFIICFVVIRSWFHYDQIEIDVTSGTQEISLIPDRFLTTSCKLIITGELDCNVKVVIPSDGSIYLKPGKVDFTRNYEWYDKGKTIKVIPDSCSQKSKLTLRYSYSARYFGQK